MPDLSVAAAHLHQEAAAEREQRWREAFVDADNARGRDLPLVLMALADAEQSTLKGQLEAAREACLSHALFSDYEAEVSARMDAEGRLAAVQALCDEWAAELRELEDEWTTEAHNPRFAGARIELARVTDDMNDPTWRDGYESGTGFCAFDLSLWLRRRGLAGGVVDG